MGKARELIDAVEVKFTENQQIQAMGEMVMIALPMQTVRALSDAAAVRNLTFAQVLSHAINEYLKKTESRQHQGPRLLTEG